MSSVKTLFMLALAKVDADNEAQVPAHVRGRLVARGRELVFEKKLDVVEAFDCLAKQLVSLLAPVSSDKAEAARLMLSGIRSDIEDCANEVEQSMIRELERVEKKSKFGVIAAADEKYQDCLSYIVHRTAQCRDVFYLVSWSLGRNAFC